ncbi:hypothetical protein [Oceanirhabdus seepicola]|uniref:Uncharacterized protein n=1 Tax=Oceanirhabdus seepicola TaxID=2828781 RepID=A0A9J6NYJ8_9CLOT|nr:hypothetical protein [Oceanirhabdus seepicola]MCM1989514.1 hypothetical protein [Oceanirhabdus seepicola]
MEKKMKYDLDVDEILVIPATESASVLSLNADLYDIESTNTKVALISATESPITTVNTDGSTQVTNRYYIQKTSPESEIVTVVSKGNFTLYTTEKTEQGEQTNELVRIMLKSNIESNT